MIVQFWDAILFASCLALTMTMARTVGPSISSTNSCRPLRNSTFCALVQAVDTPALCNALASVAETVCPPQTVLCDPSFHLETYCREQYGCTESCARYMNDCCETQCCQPPCAQLGDIICVMLDVFTCPQAKPEICPCKSDTRTSAEFCEDLVGSAGCLNACLSFLADCCNVEEGALRIGETSTKASRDGDVIVGRLEVFLNGKWGRICDTRFTQTEAEVACRQLGYFHKGEFNHSTFCSLELVADTVRFHVFLGALYNTNFPVREDDVQVLMDYVTCTGDEKRLVDCDFAAESWCSRYGDVGVECLMEPIEANQGQLRLLKTKTTEIYVEGELHIFHNDYWSNVCANSMVDSGPPIDIQASNMACRELGYSDKGKRYFCIICSAAF